MIPKLHIARTPDGNDFPLPSYTSRYHMGLNLMAAIGAPVKMNPGERLYVPVGFAIGIPVGFCGQVVSQPEMALAHGIVVADAPHLVHPADREPLFILIQNTSAHQYVLHRGEVIAQLLITPAVQVSWNVISASVQGVKTTDADMIVDDGKEVTEDASAPPKEGIQRRVKKAIRDRYKKDDE